MIRIRMIGLPIDQSQELVHQSGHFCGAELVQAGRGIPDQLANWRVLTTGGRRNGQRGWLVDGLDGGLGQFEVPTFKFPQKLNAPEIDGLQY